MRDIFLIAILVATLTGCATSAMPVNMAVHDSQARTAIYDSRLHGNIHVSEVRGGEKTNPLWTSEIDNPDFLEALRQSLENARLLGGSGSEYSLQASLLRVEQPMFGLNFTVTAEVEYEVKNTRTGNVVYREVLRTPFTAGVGDAFMAVERLRIANEGAARANISVLLERLSALKLKPEQLTLH